MRADRLLSALLLLQAHGRLTGREMARRLEVSERTVRRDMEALGASGVPIVALRGARGGWQLAGDWRTEVPGLEEAELRALLMSQPRMLGDARLAHAAERALGKLVASLPEALRAKAASIRQRLHVDTTGWRGVTESLAMLPCVQEAVAGDRRLAIRYRPAGREAGEREVDPLGLVAKGSVWYLVAATAEGLRTFRISRIEEAALLDEASARPAGFDLAAYWSESAQRFREGFSTYDAVLRLEPGAADSLRHWQAVEDLEGPDGEGWVTLRVRFDSADEACFVVLGLGSRGEVLEPDELRARVAAEAAAVVARSREPGSEYRARAESLPGPRSGGDTT